MLHRAAPTVYHETLELQDDTGRWLVARVRRPLVANALSPAVARAAAAGFAGVRLTDVAQKVGLDFRQGAFRYGVTADPPAMMGGGVCWLDYDDDGWMDLFVVNSYGEGDIGGYGRRACHAASSSGTTTGGGSRRSTRRRPRAARAASPPT